jgi:hypothetical protein
MVARLRGFLTSGIRRRFKHNVIGAQSALRIPSALMLLCEIEIGMAAIAVVRQDLLSMSTIPL